jgi:TonB family protein
MGSFSVPPKPEEGQAKKNSFGIEVPHDLKGRHQTVRKAESGGCAPGMSIKWQPWFQTFYQNLRDAIAPPKLPPLKLTSQPVTVRSIWSRDKAFGPSQIIALALHIGLIALLVAPLYQTTTYPPPAVIMIGSHTSGISPYTWRLPTGENQAHGGGGGGDRNPIPPSTGRPPSFAFVQLTPPTVTIRNQSPALAAEPTLVGNPALRIAGPSLLNFGDPLQTSVTDSNGPGTSGGIGNGHGTGIGNENGPGLGPGEDGGTGGGPYSAGTHGYGSPSCVYCPDPKYPEAARQVKFMGTVTVQVVVNPDGRASDIVVIKDPGMGLGEKAVEAVKTWQFRPALGPNDKPAATRVNIEVQFRLL